jgi:hypothetical protein
MAIATHFRYLLLIGCLGTALHSVARAEEPLAKPFVEGTATYTPNASWQSTVTDRQDSSRRKWKKAWIAAWVGYAVVNVLDTHASAGRREANPLLSNGAGRLSVGKAALIKSAIGGGFFGLQWAMARSNPHENYYKPFTFATAAGAGAMGAVAIRNYGLGPKTASGPAPTPEYLKP